ncbi:MAG: IclR family transcriptional regulator C-terminal domain-containing protein [Homoserinimonas sp.]
MSDGEGPANGAADFVQSLDRGLRVIRAFSDHHDRLSMADVARATNQSRAATRRFLLTLESLGYLGVDDKRYYLRPRVLELGYAYLSSSTNVEITQHYLEELSKELRESCSACAYDRGEVVYVARAAADRIMSVNIGVGRRLPAFATSTGRLLLSALSPAQLDDFFESYPRLALTNKTLTDEGELRELIATAGEQGWTINDEEFEQGVRAVAAPVYDDAGAMWAAVNISVPASRASMKELETKFLPRLLEVTQQISRDIKR